MKTGEIWLAQLDPTVGGEIDKARPCVVISPNEMNAHLRTVVVAPMTTTTGIRSLSGLAMGPRRGKSGRQFRRRPGRVAGPRYEPTTTSGAPRVCRIGPGPLGWAGKGADAASALTRRVNNPAALVRLASTPFPAQRGPIARPDRLLIWSPLSRSVFHCWRFWFWFGLVGLGSIG